MIEEIDLFENYQDQPKELSEITKKYSQIEAEEGISYKQCRQFLTEVKAIGYTFDYGLDSVPYGLKKIT